MISTLRKNPLGVLTFILFIIVCFLVVDSLAVPTYGLPGGPVIVCGTGDCICYCRAEPTLPGEKGSCDCRIARNIGCACFCTGGDWDECEVTD